jgi:hypothetical protein
MRGLEAADYFAPRSPSLEKEWLPESLLDLLIPIFICKRGSLDWLLSARAISAKFLVNDWPTNFGSAGMTECSTRHVGQLSF